MPKAHPQDALATMLDTEQFRHPMWKQPEPDQGLQRWIVGLRTEIAKRLVPLDGRRNCEVVIAWLAEVYEESSHHRAERDPVWLLGDMTWRLHLHTSQLTARAEKEVRPDRKAHLVSQRESMKRIHEALVDATIKASD